MTKDLDLIVQQKLKVLHMLWEIRAVSQCEAKVVKKTRMGALLTGLFVLSRVRLFATLWTV